MEGPWFLRDRGAQHLILPWTVSPPLVGHFVIGLFSCCIYRHTILGTVSYLSMFWQVQRQEKSHVLGSLSYMKQI